jgi:hypothetical protein
MQVILFPNEIFDPKKEIGIHQYKTDSEINEKYVNGEVRIVTEQARYPLPSLNGLFNSINYTLQPSFQRRKRWDNSKKSKLMESFIINVPVPPVFLYEVDFAKFEVMDGLQRISTIIDFYNDKLELSDLDEWSELNGRKYSELPEKIKEGIDRRYLSSIILLKESAKDDLQANKMKKLVFERLNSGGVKLSPQETRNALFDGELNKLCIELSNNEIFKKLWGLSDISVQISFDEESEEFEDDNLTISQRELYRTMGDVELVLRFFAFRHLEKYTGGILNNFLDAFLHQGNDLEKAVLHEYKGIFGFTIELANSLFGEYAFKQYKDYRSNWTWSVNSAKTIYDPLMSVLSQYYNTEFKLLYDQDRRVEQLKAFFMANKQSLNGKKSNKSDIENRIKIYSNLIQSLISVESKK